MSPDYHSFLIAFSLSGCGLAMAFFMSWLVSRTDRFLIAWTVGVALMAFGALIIGWYTRTLSPIFGTAGYIVLLVGLAVVFGAGREFRTGALPWRGMGVMAAVSSVAVAVPMLAGYSGLAIVILNVAATAILFVTAWDYWLGRAEARLAIMLLTGLYILTGLSFVPCAILLLRDGQWSLSQAPSNWAEDFNIGVCLATLAGIGALSLALNQARLARGHQRDAETDPLTGLLNRRALLGQIAGMEGPASLIIFDIDHFKRINDVHGHLAGDEVLRAFGEILQLSCRSQGVAARLGGEEFALLIPNSPLVAAAMLAETVRARLAHQQFTGNGTAFSSTVSAGVSYAEQGGTAFDAMLREADKALYAAKQNGRDRVAVSSDDVAFLTRTPASPSSQRGPIDLIRLKVG